jgi:hypothetical protein
MKFIVLAVALILATPALASHGDQNMKNGYCLKAPKAKWPWWATIDVNFKGACPKH